MKRMTRLVLMLAMTATMSTAAFAQAAEDPRELRAGIDRHFDVVPLTEGIALRPKSDTRGFRLIEVSRGTVVIDGNPVTGGELRNRAGEDADLILRLSYLDAAATRTFLRNERTEPERPTEKTPAAGETTVPPVEQHDEHPERRMRSTGDRVRVLGSVYVGRDEEVSGQVVAVLGSVHIEGTVRDQVVAVLGSVDLGPDAVVHGDIVSVGGQVRKAPGAHADGAVTEVALGRWDIDGSPWFGWGSFHRYGVFSAATRLVGSMFHLVLLVLLASLAFIVARTPVERSAERIADDPLRYTLIGIVAEILLFPVLFLIAIVLVITVVGIPLLLLMPFAVLFLILLALVGFSGTAYALGQWTRRRFGMGGPPALIDVALGVLTILLPLLIGRVVALGGWPVSPLALFLIATGIAVEYLAWAGGFGAVLANTFTRWRARRTARTTAVAPPPV